MSGNSFFKSELLYMGVSVFLNETKMLNYLRMQSPFFINTQFLYDPYKCPAFPAAFGSFLPECPPLSLVLSFHEFHSLSQSRALWELLPSSWEPSPGGRRKGLCEMCFWLQHLQLNTVFLSPPFFKICTLFFILFFTYYILENVSHKDLSFSLMVA